MRDIATAPLAQCNVACSPQEVGRLVREAVLAYCSLVACLVDVLGASWEPDTELFPEPFNNYSMGFRRTSGYQGGLLWHQERGRFQIHT
jgi:hypothetical protein